jgi:hypothetical protein
VAGSGISIATDDVNQKLTLSSSGAITTADISDFSAGVYSVIETDIVQGSNIVLTKDAVNKSITVAADFSGLASVASSGSYTDLINKPTYASVASNKLILFYAAMKLIRH